MTTGLDVFLTASVTCPPSSPLVAPTSRCEGRSSAATEMPWRSSGSTTHRQSSGFDQPPCTRTTSTDAAHLNEADPGGLDETEGSIERYRHDPGRAGCNARVLAVDVPG